MAATKDEVLKTAVQLERDGYDFYMTAAGNAGSGLSKETFESLARDELKHIEWIETYATAEFAAGDANKDLYKKLRPVFADIAEEDRSTAGSAAGDIDALNFAVEREEAAKNAYAAWAESVEDAEVKELCLKLVEVEAFHKELLENVIEYLGHPHDWFLREERWVVEG